MGVEILDDGYELLQYLLSRGAKVNAKTTTGVTSLHWAACHGSPLAVSALLSAGANVHAMTETGETPQDWSKYNEDKAVGNLLSTEAEKVEPVSTSKTPTTKEINDDPRSQSLSIWAILIGIDDYQKSKADGNQHLLIRNLQSCVNDTLLAEDYLRSKGVQSDHITRLITTSEAGESQSPTYRNIINALASITTSAGPGDTVYIQYSGHGARLPTAFPLLKGSGHSDGCLIPSDIKTGGQFLRDMEWHYLLSNMAAQELNVVAVIDCMSFVGSNTTRVFQTRGRSAIPTKTPLNFQEIHKRFETGSQQIGARMWQDECMGYTLIAASNSIERKYPDGKYYGVLIYNLIQLLRQEATTKFTCSALSERLEAALTGSRVTPAIRPVLLGEGWRHFP